MAPFSVVPCSSFSATGKTPFFFRTTERNVDDEHFQFQVKVSGYRYRYLDGMKQRKGQHPIHKDIDDNHLEFSMAYVQKKITYALVHRFHSHFHSFVREPRIFSQHAPNFTLDNIIFFPGTGCQAKEGFVGIELCDSRYRNT